MFPASDLRKLWLVEPHPALRIRAGFAHRLLLKLPKPRVHLFPEQNEIKGCSICSGGHHCLRANVKDWKSPTKGIQGVNVVRVRLEAVKHDRGQKARKVCINGARTERKAESMELRSGLRKEAG